MRIVCFFLIYESRDLLVCLLQILSSLIIKIQWALHKTHSIA